MTKHYWLSWFQLKRHWPNAALLCYFWPYHFIMFLYFSKNSVFSVWWEEQPKNCSSFSLSLFLFCWDLRPTSGITSALGVHGWTSSRGGESGSKFRVGFRSLLFVTAGESFASVLLLPRSRSTSFLVPPCCFCSLLLDLLSPGNLLLWVCPGCSGCQDCPSCLPWTHPISASTSSQNARMGDKRSWIKGQHSSTTGWSNFASSSELLLLATLAFSACTWSLSAHQSNVPALLPAQTQLSHLASPILNSGSDSPLPRNQDTLGSSALSAAPMTTGCWQLRA